MVESFLIGITGFGEIYQLINTNTIFTPKHTYLHKYHNVCIQTLTYVYMHVTVLCLLFSLFIYLYYGVYFAL